MKNGKKKKVFAKVVCRLFMPLTLYNICIMYALHSMLVRDFFFAVATFLHKCLPTPCAPNIDTKLTSNLTSKCSNNLRFFSTLTVILDVVARQI